MRLYVNLVQVRRQNYQEGTVYKLILKTRRYSWRRFLHKSYDNCTITRKSYLQDIECRESNLTLLRNSPLYFIRHV